jgi:hypothetical protein
MEIDGNPHAVKGVLAVVSADKEERLGVEALSEDLGEGFANPLQAGLVGGVVKGKDEDGLRAGRSGLARGESREKKDEREKYREAVRSQGNTIIASERQSRRLRKKE